MTLARRLPIGGMSSTFTAPATLPDTIELLSSGGVTGITKVAPVGWYHPTNGLLYFGYVENTTTSNANVNVCSYTVSTMTPGSPVFVGGPGHEAHAAPSVIVRETDHKVVVAMSGHDAGSTYQVEYALALTGRSATDLDASLGGSDYTYQSQVQLAGESNKLFRFYRDISGGIGRIAYSTSTDGGVTWAAATILMTASGAGNVLYFRVGSDWDTRIDILTTDNDRVAVASALYHLYYEAGAWHKSDGTTIVTSLPMAPTDATLVKSNADGAIDPGGVSVSSSNVPGGVFSVYDGVSSNTVWTCRYRAGAWQNDSISTTGGIVSANRFIGGCATPEDVPDTVWFPKKVGSYFELHKATTADDGATWSVTALETGSSTDAVLPTPVHNAISGARCLYGKGTWTSDTSYSLSVRLAT